MFTALYDALIIGVAGYAITVALGMVLLVFGLLDSGTSEGFTILASICLIAWSITYYVGFWTTSGATLGKNIGGIKVVSTDGSSVSLGQALLRYLGYVMSGVALSLGFLWAAFDRRRQGWHDKIARTYVVYSDVSFKQGDDLEFVPPDSGKPWVWLAAWVLMLILAPVLVFGGLWILGPLVIRITTAALGFSG
jgi:uncharacterized RDD family membrane protein YckC